MSKIIYKILLFTTHLNHSKGELQFAPTKIVLLPTLPRNPKRFAPSNFFPYLRPRILSLCG